MKHLIETSGTVALENGQTASFVACGQIEKTNTDMQTVSLNIAGNDVDQAKYNTPGRHSFALVGKVTTEVPDGENISVSITGASGKILVDVE